MLSPPHERDAQAREPALANWLLIAANVVIFLFTDVFGHDAGLRLKGHYTLDPLRPQVYQYLTYQFLHGGWGHLIGNMLFLWVFGEPVCRRMRSAGYLFFYLSGGVFAGAMYVQTAQNPIIGASGSIAAITTAYLALFPTRPLPPLGVALVFLGMLVWGFWNALGFLMLGVPAAGIALFIVIQVLFREVALLPGFYLIVFKVILWDNIVAPSMERGTQSSVAYSAHLGGYAFGFFAALFLLAVRGLPRNHFDMLALLGRWRRRHGLATIGVGGVRPVAVEQVDSRPLADLPRSPTEALRERVAQHLLDVEYAEAAEAYLELLRLDPTQVLARRQQLDLANYLAQTQHYAEAAQAYENALSAYPGDPDAPQYRLFLGLIYSRYLSDPARAAAHLRNALPGIELDAQRRLALDELRTIEARLAGGA